MVSLKDSSKMTKVSKPNVILSSSTIDKLLENFEFILEFKIAMNFEFIFETFWIV